MPRRVSVKLGTGEKLGSDTTDKHTQCVSMFAPRVSVSIDEYVPA